MALMQWDFDGQSVNLIATTPIKVIVCLLSMRAKEFVLAMGLIIFASRTKLS